MRVRFRTGRSAGGRNTGSTDLEMQSANKAYKDARYTSHQLKALQGLFGMSKARLENWPGARAYCLYLEKRFKPLLTPGYACIWESAGLPTPKSAEQCWVWFSAVASALHETKDEDSSIADIWKCIETRATRDPKPEIKDMSPCHTAIYSVLCWSSMLLQPDLRLPDSKSPPVACTPRQLQSTEYALRKDFVRRPTPVIFRNFQRIMPGTRWRHPIKEERDSESIVLHVPSLNFECLQTIGKIRLIWVDNLTSHLDFDASNRQLSLFRFPSFCALNTQRDGDVPPVLSGIVHALYSIETKGNITQVHQEILMSYRLLFGQTRRSRQQAAKELKALKQSGEDYDTLLEMVCTQRNDRKLQSLPGSMWPVTCRSFDGTLQEESAYSSQDDFPLFGQRLAKLQEFSLRQQPSKLRDLWRDRRNPLQWYTFWAVLVVGGLSITLGFLQLMVGIAQLFAQIYAS